MFRLLSKKTVYALIENKILNSEDYDIYVYSIEIIYLNSGILFVCLVVSILLNDLGHFVALNVFFIPTRMLSGGYHCKKSETCFICSILCYIMSLLFVDYIWNYHQQVTIFMQFLGVLSIIELLLFSPLVNVKHPLELYQIRRNKKILFFTIIFQIFVYVVLFINNNAFSRNQLIFIILSGVILLIGRNKKVDIN